MPDGPEDGDTPSVDRIRALPDDVLHLVLSWLPTDETVRTSALAQRWRHLWRSARAVRVTRRGKENWTQRSVTNFVNHLLLLRAVRSPIDELEISCGRLRADRCYKDRGCCYCDYNDRVWPLPSGVAEAEDLSRSAGTWIRHALSICNARALHVSFFHGRRHRLRLDAVPFVSEVLTRAVLTDATFESGCLDFSRCPALEDLSMSACTIRVHRILSPSLRRLRISECSFDSTTSRTRVSTPSLLSLELSVGSGKAPFLEKMPLLVAARVRLCGHERADVCTNNGCPVDCNGNSSDGCKGSAGDDGCSVLLARLSGATDLDLTSQPRVFLFRRDCKFSTTFANLKTLVLNGWCLVADSTLVYFLRYSPILEKLTIQLEYCKTEDAVVVMDDNYSRTEKFLVSKQLKEVHIKCQEENKLVSKVLMTLNAYGVPPERINVDQNFCPSVYSDETSDSETDYYW